MQVLTEEEIAAVSGAGVIKDVVDDIKSADFIGAYDHVVDAVAHVIERVANSLK